MSNNIKNILWTATSFSLPKDLWKRLENMGYRVLLTDTDDNMPGKILDLSPSLWVGQINGNAESIFSGLREIKKKHPGLPVIFISSQPSIEDAINAIKSGASEYITESISTEYLWSILEKTLKYPCIPLASQPFRSTRISDQHRPVAAHSSMLKVLKLAEKISSSLSTVLITGETGVGKEVVAKFIHACSDRKSGPFVAVNCAALPENLLESELFGHEKGAFTGAISRKKGKFELANNGTILLDEISETTPSIQAKLLRVLQEREIDRVGGERSLPVDVRVIATTNRDLESETKNGNFRLDLFYRLNVVPIELPPLRQRPDDIVPLADLFLKKYCARNDAPIKKLSHDAIDFLKRKNWPGNVREFENLMERTALLIDSELVQAADLEMICNPGNRPEHVDIAGNGIVPLKEIEKKMIFRALDDHEGNRTHAAKALGISIRTLRNKLNEYKAEMENQ
ncbi:MAG: sigma-54-dependent Fis family transcriptional regulator [Deltaproteobacteria bacterium]|nr:sigma-54-dependent Fis family transcriptional regulator [Deltaproteobacteria bacterium]